MYIKGSRKKPDGIQMRRKLKQTDVERWEIFVVAYLSSISDRSLTKIEIEDYSGWETKSTNDSKQADKDKAAWCARTQSKEARPYSSMYKFLETSSIFSVCPLFVALDRKAVTILSKF